MVNNDFTEWKMYAIGGSANPTINSQGNRYIAPMDPDAKEVLYIHIYIYFGSLFLFLAFEQVWEENYECN